MWSEQTDLQTRCKILNKTEAQIQAYQNMKKQMQCSAENNRQTET